MCNEKKSIKALVGTFCTTGIMVNASIKMAESAYEFSKDIAVQTQPYIGSIGSEIVEYGYPLITGISMLGLTFLVGQSTLNYFLNKEDEINEREK